MKFKFFLLFFLFNFSFLSFSNGEIDIPVWKIPFIDCEVKVDGKLDEQAYSNAFKWEKFYQTSPGYNIEPSEKTTLYLFVNKKGLVIGIEADANKVDFSRSKVRRDGGFLGEHFEISFDTAGLGKFYYFLAINPANSIGDGTIDNGNVSLSYDMIFEHATNMFEKNYTVEILIPFSEINISETRNQKWLFTLTRFINTKKAYECDSIWKTNRDTTDVRDENVYLVFSLPHKVSSRKKKLKLIPSLVVSHLKHKEEFFGEKGSFSSDKGDLGLTVEYSPSTNTTMKATIHPDFSQVEADDTYQRVNNRYPVYLREKRPFFMDGMESFSTPFELLYTRRIVKPEYGVKFSTKIKNKYGLYLISAMEKDVPSERFGYERDFEKDVYWNVIRSTYNLDNKGSFLGFMAVQRNYGSDFNRVISGDGNIVYKKLTFSFQGVITTLNQGEKTETGNAIDMDIYYKHNQYFSCGFTYDGVSPDFRDDAGFFQKVNYRSYHPYLKIKYLSKTDKAFLNSFQFRLSAENNYNYSSELIDQIVNISTGFSFIHQVNLYFVYSVNSSLKYMEDYYKTHLLSCYFNYGEFEKFSPFVNYFKGTDVLYGDNPQVVNVKAYFVGIDSRFERINLSIWGGVYDYTDRATGEILRKQRSLEVVGTYFFNDHTNFKVFYISDLADIRDYNYNEPYHYINFLFTWRKNAFTKLYIGYNNGHSTYRLTDKTMWGFEQDKYFYAKISYLF